MKTMLFNNHYGLANKVISLKKTMTRRSINDKLLCDAMEYACGDIELRDKYLIEHARYKVDDVVAIAQSYKDIQNYIDECEIGFLPSWLRWESFAAFKKAMREDDITKSAGYNNMMFVNPELMPHHIRILSVGVQYLQEIDVIDACFEGIELCKYKDVFGRTKVGYEFFNCPHVFKSPIDAFACLIDKVSGKGTWDSNPLVYVYSFELID